MPIKILKSKKIPISNISANSMYKYIISNEFGYQILVTKACNEGRISYILTNFILIISALNSRNLFVS